MEITKDIRKQLDELRVTGLARYAAMKEAKQAYEDAKARERAAYEYAANHGEFYTEAGECVTGEKDAFLMDEAKFIDEFVPLISQGYKELFGLDYPVGYTPVFEQYQDPYICARREYWKIATDFLRISGKEDYAKKVESALENYLYPTYVEQLEKINQKFLGVE